MFRPLQQPPIVRCVKGAEESNRRLTLEDDF